MSNPWKEWEEIKQARKEKIHRQYLERIEREAKLSRMLPEERLKFFQKEQQESFMESENERKRIGEKLSNDSLNDRLSRSERYAQEAMKEMDK
ncbi:hypothetical protein [Bacillus sp. Bos-x628]|uniref:hypothetical protein n=1 Tax=Bacillus maqinnsis TaxID=3229854 RepID=UPI00338F34F3